MTAISIVSVSQLNKQIRFYLENDLGPVHVEGEISNLSKPGSGHFYFTLKDTTAQIRCVFFKNRHNVESKQVLQDGQKLVAHGRLSLYEARGDYQLIVESITEAGLGALFQKFEALKKKLALEGLFEVSRKKNLPLFPETIAVITSNTGAAIRDILATLAKRYPLAKVLIYPSEVQGIRAASQLVQALQRAKRDGLADVLILARGGGSLEDLWAFNDESLAREIASSHFPIVSGVGHETDFTIADFVADYRAETPTAAATAVTPNGADLLILFKNFANRLDLALLKNLDHLKLRLHHLQDKIASPKMSITAHYQTLDYLENRLSGTIKQSITQKKQQLEQSQLRLYAQSPKNRIAEASHRLQQLTPQIQQLMQSGLQQLQQKFSNTLSTLHAVSPLATLDRGYAIATKNKTVLRSSSEIEIEDTFQLRLCEGELLCKVLSKI